MMLNYEKAREDAAQRKQELEERLKNIPSERSKLDREEEAIKRELLGLEQILDGLELATSDTPPDFEPSGFTDKIRKILSETPVPLRPTQVRDKLEEIGVTGTSSKNLLISVHTVIDRIKDELFETNQEDGKVAYTRNIPWIGDNVFAKRVFGEYGKMRSLGDLAATPRVPEDHPLRKLAAKPRQK